MSESLGDWVRSDYCGELRRTQIGEAAWISRKLTAVIWRGEDIRTADSRKLSY